MSKNPSLNQNGKSYRLRKEKGGHVVVARHRRANGSCELSRRGYRPLLTSIDEGESHEESRICMIKEEVPR